VEHERWGTPVASYVAGLPPDARPLDRGKPRDEDTEGGSQPADKSLINRRLSLHSQPCAAMAFLADGELAEQALNYASPLDREHKRLARPEPDVIRPPTPVEEPQPSEPVGLPEPPPDSIIPPMPPERSRSRLRNPQKSRL
jgi:hypothetical protein